MGDQHFHITTVLIEDEDRIAAFEEACGQHFRSVMRWGCTIVLYSKDFDGISSELEMPDIMEALSGILEHDIEIVSAWEPCGRGDRERHRVWRVTGTSDELRLPPVTDPDDPQYEEPAEVPQ